MERVWTSIGLTLVAALCLAPSLPAQIGPDFTDSAEIIPLNRPANSGTHAEGEVRYDEAKQEYYVAGNGWDIQENGDECFFVYRKITGSWRIEAEVEWIGGPNEWSKAGLMCRVTTDGDSAQTNVITSGVAGFSAPDRVEEGARLSQGAGYATTWEYLPEDMYGLPTLIAMTRIASSNLFIRQYYNTVTNQWVSYAQTVEMPDEVLLGLATTSHQDDDNSWAEAYFRNVKIEAVAAVAATRQLPSVIYEPEKANPVSIEIGGGAGSVTLIETPPAGWAVTEISDGGTFEDGTITWTLTFAGGTKMLTYVTTPPSGATENGVFSGTAGDLSIFGPSVMVLAKPIGIFEDHMDIGAVAAEGDATLNSDTGEYAVTGSGADIWGSADEFHFVYTEVSGSFEIEGQAYVEIVDAAGEGLTWGKAEIMVRDSLDPGAIHYSGMIRTQDQGFELQSRASTDGASVEVGPIQAENLHYGHMKVARQGSLLSLYYFDPGVEDWILQNRQPMNFTDPLFVGLAVTSHDDGRYVTGYFTNVTLTVFPFGASRTLSAASITPGGSLDVTLILDVTEGLTTGFTIVEDYPDGVTLSNVSASVGEAKDEAGVITWTGTGVSADATLSYTISVGSDVAAGAVMNISGTYDDGAGYAGSTGSVDLLVMDMAPTDLGIFDGHMDIGEQSTVTGVGRAGDEWAVIGTGHDIWDAADDFHFLYKRVEGDFRLLIEDAFIGPIGERPTTSTWAKMGIMARQSLTAPSAYAYACIRSEDQDFMLQWREEDGAGAADAAGYTDSPELTGVIGLQREENNFIAFYIDAAGEEVINNEYWVEMEDPIWIGIAVTSHETGSTGVGQFSNPQFTGTAVSVKEWMIY